jgi:hypothetical protein
MTPCWMRSTFGDDLNRLENAIFKTMKKLKRHDGAHVRMSIVGPQAPAGSMRPVCATESRNGKVTLWGDMDKMHLVLSSDNVFILVSDKITKKAWP